MSDELERQLGAYGLDEHEHWFEIRDLISQYTQQETLKARIDELSHVGGDVDGELIVCYFTQENPDCSNDLPIGERIAELQAQLTTNKSREAAPNE